MHSSWVKSLNVKYTNKHNKKLKTVEDTTKDQKSEDIHWKLNLTVRCVLKSHWQLAGSKVTHPFMDNYEQYGEIDLGYNVLVANIGFIVSTMPVQKDHSHGREFLTFPIKEPNLLTFDLNDLKNTANKFADDIMIRHPQRRNRQDILSSPGWYAHSEELLVSHLESDDFIKSLPELLKSKNKNPNEDYKIYAVILDIHSYRYPCDSCKDTLDTYLQKSGELTGGFLQKLYIHLASDSRYILSKNHYPYLKVRISAARYHDMRSPTVAVDDHREDKEGGRNLKEKGLLFRHEHTDFYPKTFLEGCINPASLKSHTIFFNAQNKRKLYDKDEKLPVDSFFSRKDKTKWERSISMSVAVGLFRAFIKPTIQDAPKSEVAVISTKEMVTIPTEELTKAFDNAIPIIKELLR